MQPIASAWIARVSGLTPGIPPTGIPIFETIDPTDLFIDPAYQRSIGKRGLMRVRRIIEDFDRAKFKPSLCAYSEHEGVRSLMDSRRYAFQADKLAPKRRGNRAGFRNEINARKRGRVRVFKGLKSKKPCENRAFEKNGGR